MSQFENGDRVSHFAWGLGVVDGDIDFDGKVGVKFDDGEYRAVQRCQLDKRVPIQPKPKTRLYLAGGMRGIPFFNFPAFDGAADALEQAGYNVWSPADHDREVYGDSFELDYPTGEEDGNFNLREALAADTNTICVWADGIALLEGWEKSSGARAEKALAEALGLPVKSVDTWVACVDTSSRWAEEREDIIERFTAELRKATGDGSKKRQAGEKPPWYRDDTHLGAVFSHLTKWFRGETVDPDSGGHPLGHAAWRLLAIACQETGNTPDGDVVFNFIDGAE